MKGLNNKELSKIKLQQEIEKLEKKKKDLDFISKYETKIASLTAAKNETNLKHKHALHDINKLESEIDLILEVDKHIPKNINIVKRGKVRGDAIANLCTGDWHFEESVKPEEVQYYNKFNPQIAEQRVKNLFSIGLRLVEIERYAADIRKLVIYIVGDLLSGLIHDDLRMSNTMLPAEAVLFIEDLLASGISFLESKGKFDEIEVICHTGNHSRYTQGKFIHHKGQAQKTFEWIIYHHLAKTFDRLNKHKIKFVIPRGSIYTTKEFKFPIRSQHGSNFKYSGGIGGAYIPINKKLLRWDKKENAYLNVFGHLHQYDTPRNYVQIGSLIGYNQYAQDMGYEYEPPKQAFFLIEKKLGLIVNRPIYVDVESVSDDR